MNAVWAALWSQNPVLLCQTQHLIAKNLAPHLCMWTQQQTQHASDFLRWIMGIIVKQNNFPTVLILPLMCVPYELFGNLAGSRSSGRAQWAQPQKPPPLEWITHIPGIVISDPHHPNDIRNDDQPFKGWYSLILSRPPTIHITKWQFTAALIYLSLNTINTFQIKLLINSVNLDILSCEVDGTQREGPDWIHLVRACAV